jgi:hypothetical protein
MITGTAPIDTQTVGRSVPATLEILTEQTTLSGRVLSTIDETPLEGVTLSIGFVTARGEASGRFFMVGPPTGEQILLIDGATTTNPPGVYQTLPIKVTILPNTTNVLHHIPHLVPVDTSVVFPLQIARTACLLVKTIPSYRSIFKV